jgi:hypothetical protein
VFAGQLEIATVTIHELLTVVGEAMNVFLAQHRILLANDPLAADLTAALARFQQLRASFPAA